MCVCMEEEEELGIYIDFMRETHRRENKMRERKDEEGKTMESDLRHRDCSVFERN